MELDASWVFMMGSKGRREIYVGTCGERLLEVVDHLLDQGFKLGPCAKWYYLQKLREEFECYHIENDDELFFGKP
jgi:hypothetical protein